jgi:hypothetical protein
MMADLLNHQFRLAIVFTPRRKKQFPEESIQRFLDTDIRGTGDVQLTPQTRKEQLEYG